MTRKWTRRLIAAIAAFFGLVLACAVASGFGAALMAYVSGDIPPAGA